MVTFLDKSPTITRKSFKTDELEIDNIFHAQCYHPPKEISTTALLVAFLKVCSTKKKIFFCRLKTFFFNRLVMVFTWFKKVYLLKLEKKWLNMKFHQPLLLMDKREILHLFDFGKTYFIIFLTFFNYILIIPIALST